MTEQPLQIEVVPGLKEATTVFRLAGPIMLTNFFQLQSLIRSDASRHLILDLAGVPYVDSAGIGCLVGGHVSHQKGDRRFSLAAVNERVMNTFVITGVDKVLVCFPTPEAAEQTAIAAQSA